MKSLNDLMQNLDKNNNPNEVLPMLLLMMSTQKDDTFDALTNLATLLDGETLINVLTIFEGVTITFPSVKDYRITMLALMVVYEKHLLDKSYSNVLDSVDKEEFDEVMAMYNTLIKDRNFMFTIKELAQQ